MTWTPDPNDPDERYRPPIEPRRSLRCSFGMHKYLSYSLDPHKFECARCTDKKDYGKVGKFDFCGGDNRGPETIHVIGNNGTRQLLAERLAPTVYVLSQPRANQLTDLFRVRPTYSYVEPKSKWFFRSGPSYPERFFLRRVAAKFGKVIQPYTKDDGTFEMTRDLKVLLDMAL